jgi:hypothetical protein
MLLMIGKKSLAFKTNIIYIFFAFIGLISGSSSVVELLVANEKVAGSSPVSRSFKGKFGANYALRLFWRRSQVAKATVCKTVIQRFESARRLCSAEVAE